jgi:hypothetical protein
MEEIKIGDYLLNPERIQAAIDALEGKCNELGFMELHDMFIEALGIQTGDGFPITGVVLGGTFCRARLNDSTFDYARSVTEIGARLKDVTQGRANPRHIPVFYAANNKQTATFEVLQNEPPGKYIVTIGCWE